MIKYKIRNAHCAYYEGQTGLCRAKEFVKCNPVNCKLYTIDELSTILDLQEQLKRKEQECVELRKNLKLDVDCLESKYQLLYHEAIKDLYNRLQEYNQIIIEVKEYCIDPNLKYDKTTCDILNIINKTKEN